MPKNLPWQVAMLEVQGDNILSQYMRYIKWYRPPNVSPEAAVVTRFRPEMVSQHGMDYKVVIADVVEATSKADYIIGHNVLGFDIHFLHEFYKQTGKSPIGIAEKIIDTHALAKGIKISDSYNPKTTTLLEYQYRMIHTIVKGVKTNTKTLGTEYGIEHDYENLHDALNDLHLNFKIWQKIKLQVEV